MTETDLMQYQSIKKEIGDLNKRIEETKQEAEVVQFGTVKGSSKYFPYTPQNFKVSGIDPTDAASRQQKISDLLRQREFKRNELVSKQLDIEEYISSIEDSTTRLIFRMHFIDGDTQIKIAKTLKYDQSVISRKIKGYINLHKKHNKMC